MALTIILVLGVIWAFISIVAAIFYFVGGGYVILFAFVGSALIGLGIVYLIGGLLTLLSCYYILKRIEFQRALIFCIIGSVIALVTGGVIIGIIGLVFAILLNNEKHRFTT